MSSDRRRAVGGAAAPPALGYVRVGTFSGIAVSLRDAIAARVAVDDIDLLGHARDPRLLLARARGVAEARRAGRGTPWTKTAAWSRALQRATEERLGDRRALFVQTLGAFAPRTDRRYAVYTDRVGEEGLRASSRFASRATDGWLARERAFLRGAERIFTCGPSTAAILEQIYGIAEDRIAVVGGGPNTPLPPRRRRERCERLLFVGMEWERKGGPELLEAFARVRARRPELELLLCGAEPPGPVPPGVRVLGAIPRDEVGELYAIADALVIPTHMEAFGIALIEAVEAGLPCIGTTVGNQGWILGDAGIRVPPGDVDALEQALDTLVDDYPQLEERARRRGGEVEERLSWDAVARAIVGTFIAVERPAVTG